MNDKNTANLGRNRLIRQLSRRITRHFKRGIRDAPDNSLVIGIFGEWGSGKSWILEQLALSFEEEEHRVLTTDADKKALVLPIRFNPWRFEAEEHLIVPLLMTTHNALIKHAAVNQGFQEKLRKGAEYFFNSSLAFASAWKFKVGLPGVGSCDFSPEAALKAQKELQDNIKKEKELPPDLNSCYYDFENQLKEVTGQGLKLLFLIDDIDRCLPERAVQMLEAIKLFLDVPECVFVLGVDDEVVERGIRHRYRDYNNVSPVSEEQGNGNQRDTLPPITGAEYLEKIIHLPIRLPLMRRRQVAELLEHRYPALFKIKYDTTAENELADGRQLKDSGEAQQLLDLFEYAVPLIPRKLIRASELLEFLIELSESFQPDKLLLARLVLLQLFAPEVFRHLRRTNHWLLKVWAEWQSGSEQDIFRLVELNGILSNTAHHEQPTWSSEEGPLLRKLLEAGRNRVNFDPCRVLKGLAPEAIPENLLDYFHLVGKQNESSPPGKITAEFEPLSSSLSGYQELETARLTDQQGFLADLFNEREASWRKALDSEELQGKALDDDTFGQILAEVQKTVNRLNDYPWLEALSRRLTNAQINRLDTEFQVREKLVQYMRTSRPVAERAAAGRVLGLLGDPRPGVTVRRDNRALPDIDWVEIRAVKGFMMGSDDKDADSTEKPGHPVDVDTFSISRYSITNAQFRCFIEAGGYEERKYWQHEAARDWLNRNTEQHTPEYWHDRKWNNPNHPVVGVSWFEALAFCVWLQEVVGKPVRLPTEEEWEYAARGIKGLRYAWGNTFSAELGNTEKTGLERTSTVGLFPPDKAFGLHDMTGNVWEWTNSLDSDQNPFIRGGSWYGTPRFARCSFRYWNIPVNRNDNLGFRVVFSPAAC